MSPLIAPPTSAKRISDRLYVSAQPDLADFAALSAAGFTGVISNRPGGEAPDQPSPDAEHRAAEAAGLIFDFIPVTAATITEADVRAFQAAFVGTEGPVFAHCRSGMRSANLFAIGEALDGRVTPDDLTALSADWGIDLTLARQWLAREARRRPRVHALFDPCTFSVQYVVSNSETQQCAIIDPVLDYDEKSGTVATTNADALLVYVAEQKLTVQWMLDTHPHADHFSAAAYLHEKTGAPVAIGAQVVEVQRLWQSLYNLPALKTDGSQSDRLVSDGDAFHIGTIPARVVFSPGHTLSLRHLCDRRCRLHA